MHSPRIKSENIIFYPKQVYVLLHCVSPYIVANILLINSKALEHDFNLKNVPGQIDQLKKMKLYMCLSVFLDQDLYDKSC